MAEYDALIAAAKKSRQHAHAKFSNFHVGAALRTASGKIFGGCNVENATYGLTVCAERVALFKAISEGERQFDAIAGGYGYGSAHTSLWSLPSIDLGILRRCARGSGESERRDRNHSDARTFPKTLRFVQPLKASRLLPSSTLPPSVP